MTLITVGPSYWSCGWRKQNSAARFQNLVLDVLSYTYGCKVLLLMWYMSCLRDPVHEIFFQIPLPEIITQMLCLCLGSDIPSAVKVFQYLIMPLVYPTLILKNMFLKMQVITYLSPLLYWHCKMSKMENTVMPGIWIKVQAWYKSLLHHAFQKTCFPSFTEKRSCASFLPHFQVIQTTRLLENSPLEYSCPNYNQSN